VGQAADQLSGAEASPYGVATPPRPMGGSPSADELRAQIERQRSELGRDLEVLGDKVSPGRMVDRRKEAVRQRTRGWKDRIMGATDSATSRMSDTADSMGQHLHEAPTAARHQVQGNPLAAGLVAFGAGAVLAALLPTSEKERRMAQQATPALERAAEEAGSLAMQTKDDLQPMAQDAVQHVKDDAQQAADQVKQEAQGAANEVKTTAQP
jgi:gas vesicle protein